MEVYLEKTLQAFREAFEPYTVANPEYRYFLCEGSPLLPDAFIVGINATIGVANFWNYWDDEYGYRKSVLYHDYLNERGGRPSKTRVRIEALLDHTGSPRCIETNIFSQPTPAANLIDDFSTRSFDVLLRTLKPKVLLLHGKKPRQHIVKKFGLSDLEQQACRDGFAPVQLPWGRCLIRMVKHLSTPHWNQAVRLVALGTEFRDAIVASRQTIEHRSKA
jgi:hypothetical protein